jgi:diketogulonate reductase-like aldo/keto reductase
VDRGDLFITTKVEPKGKQAAKDLILKTSLPSLGVDYIDLVLIHFPCVEFWITGVCGGLNRAQRVATWEGLIELQQMGKVRAIGVSNYNTGEISELQGTSIPVPAVNQVQWHLGYHDEALLTAMKASNIALGAWGSLDGKTPAEHHTPGVPLSDPRLKPMAQRLGISTAQLALRWSVHKGVTPVTFTCNKDHAQQDLTAFVGDLTEDDVSYLDSLKPGGPSPPPPTPAPTPAPTLAPVPSPTPVPAPTPGHFSCDQCEAQGYKKDVCNCGICGSFGLCSFSCKEGGGRVACDRDVLV